MQEIIQKTEEFLNRYKIDAGQIDMDQLIASFLSEMEKGLQVIRSSRRYSDLYRDKRPFRSPAVIASCIA